MKESTELAWAKCKAPAPIAESTVIAIMIRSRFDSSGAVAVVIGCLQRT
jgi:hypothetical protein